MRKNLRTFVFLFCLAFSHDLLSQVLVVKKVTQEYDQWCWAGVSSSILDYYNHPRQQCEIAEFTRSVSTWHNFGPTDCCENPNVGCNYWNYMWGYKGSIEDILMFFGGLSIGGLDRPLTLTDINSQIGLGRVFVVRWGWTSGGGHFVLGYGIRGDTVYYMNPWFGEGMKIGQYEWLKEGSNHVWTNTIILMNPPPVTSVSKFSGPDPGRIYPNPASDFITIENLSCKQVEIYNIMGNSVLRTMDQSKLNISGFSPGIYVVRVSGEDHSIRYFRLIKE